MSGPIDEAPTPQNTPANAQSYMHKAQNASIPSTIAELVENPSELMSNPLLQSMIQDKLQTLIGEDSGYISNLPINLKNRIYALKALQQDQFKLEAEFQMKLLELERSFADKFSVVNSKRRQLVVGEVEATKEAIIIGKELLEEEDEDDEEEEENDNDSNGIKGIPGFWLTALQNVPLINNLITDRDFDVLDTLVDVRLEYLETPGYKLVFEFEENEFFKNKVLEKTYYYQKELGYTGEFVYDYSEGCDIDWKSNDVNVTIEIEQRKQRNKHTKQVRIIEKTTHVESFFNFFKPPQLPDNQKKSEEEEGKEEDEEEEAEDIDDELAQSLQMDYLLGELIKDKLIPRAIDCFTGEATNNGLFDMEEVEEEEEFEGEFDEGDDDDEEGEEDDDEDDDEDEEEGDGIEHKPQQQQECKQQ